MYRWHYSEEVQVVVPTGCLGKERLGPAPTVALDIDRYHTKSAVMILPKEVAPGQENSKIVLEDYKRRNSYKLLHWEVAAHRSAGNTALVDPRTEDMLRT